MRVIEDDDRGRRKLRHLREQRRQRIEFPIRLQLALERRRGKRVPAGGGTQREKEQVDEAGTIILGIERGPRDERAALEPVTSPLRQQRRLAETLRRGNDDGGTFADLVLSLIEARARHHLPTEPRRRRLQLEMGVRHRSGSINHWPGDASLHPPHREWGGGQHPTGSLRPRWRPNSTA